MIEGILRHCTELEVDHQYMDSHGQSVAAFAFARLLGFQLLPRLKAIHAQRLYRSDVRQADGYSNLQPVLSRPIDWELIRRQSDETVKYATALRLGTAEAEAIGVGGLVPGVDQAIRSCDWRSRSMRGVTSAAETGRLNR